MTPRGRRVLQGLLGGAALAGLAVALVRAMQDAEDLTLPGAWRLVVSGAVLAVAVGSAASAWGRLLPGQRFVDVLPGYSLAQVTKYLPGSVWQGVGQVADAGRLGVPFATGSFLFLVQMGLQAIAASAASVLAIFAVELPGVLVIPVVAGPLALLLVRRRWLDLALRMAAGRMRRIQRAEITLPSQGQLTDAATRSLICILGVGASFAVLVPTTGGTREFVGAAGVFILAWLVGFLVVPLPAGLGVREAVLVLGLGSTYGTAEVLAAAVLARVVLVVVEGGYVAVGQMLRIGRAQRSTG